MANLPQSLSMNAPFGVPSASNPASAAVAGAPANKDRKMASAEHLVLDLSSPDLRENALLELSKVTTALPSRWLNFCFLGKKLRIEKLGFCLKPS